MYLNHSKGSNSCVSRKLAQTSPWKDMHMVVHTAVPETCCLILLLNSEKLFFNTNSAVLTKSSMGIHFLSCLSKASPKALNPASWGMLGHNPTASVVSKIALSGILLRFLVLFMKSPESLIYDQHDGFQRMVKKL